MKNVNKNIEHSRGGFSFPLSDESTPITIGIKYSDNLLYNLELQEVYCICTIAPTTTNIIVDVLKEGASILTDKCIIPVGATKSTYGFINNSTILNSDTLSFEVLQGDAVGAGLKVQGRGLELNDKLV